MRIPRGGKESGLTLLEVLLVLGLLVVVLTKAALVTSSMMRYQGEEGDAIRVEDQVSQVLDRIAYEVMSCDFDTLVPLVELPNDTSGVQYQFALGLMDGAVVWSDPQEIAFSSLDNGIWWRENPDGPDERQVAWTNIARPFLEGETLNGVDDNGNGLIDERGLSFAIDGREVTIRLTLERPDEDGHPRPYTRETTVVCRN